MKSATNNQIHQSSSVAEQSDCPRASEFRDRTKILVIAYGNPLRGDDGFGWHLAQTLNDLNLEHLEVITQHQLMPELAEIMAQSRAVIFVDASLEVLAGRIVVRELEPNCSTESLTHHLEPEHLLGLTRALFGRVPRAHLISVGISSLGFSEHLSPEVSAVIPCVQSILREFAASDPASDPLTVAIGSRHELGTK